ncbi:4-(cytidine 5'-diphospho)-2-C-methyl-D-erythritol kinase [Candidatus Chlorohelix sp.]|uniref:4-(cytidine 5'-diphospho)-2-C-methyl-D-erythritol kinase n=1 Tax=Candidatus Chlorohelix sp. TaxID=3139201 RepID=UPI0030211307
MSEIIKTEASENAEANTPTIAAANPDNPERQSFPAYAKLNLSLEILSKRLDGFHDLASVMQTVSLADTLYLAPSADIEFDCNLPELVDETNLVWRAANMLHELVPFGEKRGVSLYLEKAIPVAAGLGGGSSDAATALFAINWFWNLGLSAEKLEEMSARLGSDVPFFIKGGTALVEGRGEKLTPLPPLGKYWMVLLYPEVNLPANKTATLYRSLARNDFSGGQITRELVKSIRAEKPLSESLLFNSFERLVYDLFPEIDYYRNAMVNAGAEFVRVSGSGPTLYALVGSKEEGRNIVNTLEQAGYLVYLAETVESTFA